MSDPIRSEIEREIADNTILVYGKGTKDAPLCGFTMETIQFFNHFGYPFEVVNVLENMPKRAALAEMPTGRRCRKCSLRASSSATPTSSRRWSKTASSKRYSKQPSSART